GIGQQGLHQCNHVEDDALWIVLLLPHAHEHYRISRTRRRRITARYGDRRSRSERRLEPCCKGRGKLPIDCKNTDVSSWHRPLDATVANVTCRLGARSTRAGQRDGTAEVNATTHVDIAPAGALQGLAPARHIAERPTDTFAI